ncbi:glycosyltransferase family 2 protein [Amnibacterium endophyticum]|uniref:Glycosyltransferase family 2 protein n=1 Tax=Amnibacterium endophyticum TaxID=2109337 RepID=A0ABW4LAJ6_9MICO
MSVSVVVPAYDSCETVEAAIRSALNQTVPPLEVLVVDDASSDATAAVVERIARDEPAVRLVRLPANAGVSAARNTGIGLARGRWIALLDADDVWLPDKLEVQLAFAADDPRLDLIGAWFVEQFGERLGAVREELWWPSALLVKREVFDDLLFDPCWRTSELPEFFSRFDERFTRDGVRRPLLRYRMNTTGVAHRTFITERMAWLLIGENRRRRRAGRDEIAFDDLQRWFRSAYSAPRQRRLHTRWRSERLLRSAAMAASERRFGRAVVLGVGGVLLAPTAVLAHRRRLGSVRRAAGQRRVTGE